MPCRSIWRNTIACAIKRLRQDARTPDRFSFSFNRNEHAMISGKTTLIAHIGFPTESFKAPMIYNPWFEQQGVDAVVMPMGVKAEDYAAALPLIMRMSNLRGALITMPHKVTTLSLVDETTPTARIAGACNAILKRPDGTLLGDMFDGAGFVRGVQRKGRSFESARVLVSGSGGVGSAIAASIAAAGAAELALFDAYPASAEALAGRLRAHYSKLVVRTGANDPAGFDIVVNATPLGMQEGDPLPFDVTRIAPTTFVGEVVMKTEITPLLRAALDKGCQVQVGTDMLFEQIPAYLEFFGFGSTTAEALRAVAKLQY
jgi:shikimate dehydrogenase